MDKRYVFGVLLIVLVGLVGLGWAQEGDPNLVGWWKLNEVSGTTAIDSSGNQLNGTLVGDPQWVPGTINGALEFDGVGDWVNCGTSDLFTIQQEITMACWIKVAQFTSGWEAFLTKGDNAYRISRSQSGGTTHMGLNGTNLGWFDGSVNVEDDEWHHVAGVYNGSRASIYIDGALDTARSTSGLINAQAGDSLYIGANSTQPGRQITGIMDDVRLYNRALQAVEIPVIMYGETYPFAYAPVPANGIAVAITEMTLEWKAGDFTSGVSTHLVYLDPNEQKVIARSDCQVNGITTTDPFYAVPDTLALGTTYYWVVDEEDGGTTSPGTVWSFTVAPKTASQPTPGDNAQLVIPPVTLEWLPGAGSIRHSVYFSTNRNDVVNGYDDADIGSRTESSYIPPSLDFGRIYYWRIDEYDGNKTYQGDIWSFTTIGPNVGMRGQYYNNTTLDGDPVLTRTDYNVNYDWGIESPNPLVEVDNFSARWSGLLDVAVSDTYTFSIYCLSEDGVRLWVNGQQIINNWPAFNPDGFEGTIDLMAGQISVVMEFYETSYGAVAKLSWESPSMTRQIIPIGAFSLPVSAFIVSPFNGDTEINSTLRLRWNPGEDAAEHDVYFGTSFADVNTADTSTAGVYRGRQPLDDIEYVPAEVPLSWDTTYYWRIDEVNDTDIWKGDVWSFTTGNFQVVDDFEDYNNSGVPGDNRIFETWRDRWEFTNPDNSSTPGNGTGMTVGVDTAPYGPEQAIVNKGLQSLPLTYDNTQAPYYSETDRTFSGPKNWITDGAHAFTTLGLAYRGRPGDPGSMTYDSTTQQYVITGAGTDIWDTADQCHFAYLPLNGDGSMTVKVESVENTNEWAKAGVMIREGLDADAVNVYAAVAPSGRVTSQIREFAGAETTSEETGAGSITLPHWVKLTREGNIITAEHSTDGQNWESVGINTPVSISMFGDVYVGLAVTSHAGSYVPCTAVFSNLSAEGLSGLPFTTLEDIGLPINSPANLYVRLEDSSGMTGTFNHPDDPSAVLASEWAEWRIDLSQFSNQGVDLTRIQKMVIRIGDQQPDGTGKLYIDDIRLYPE